MIDLADAANLFDSLSRLIRSPPNDTAKEKSTILASSKIGIRGLQTILGVNPDGVWGSISQSALDGASINDLVDAILHTSTIPTLPDPQHTPTPTPSPLPPVVSIPHAGDYATKFTSMIINTNLLPEIKNIAISISHNQNRYQTVASAVGLTYWPLVGIIHNLESRKMDFSSHLYNGDPLTGKTLHIPPGRPISGNPPFTWEAAAIDALVYKSFDKWHDWTVIGCAYMLEMYNGMGYRIRNVASPYLWAGSSIYTKGFFTSDGHFDPNAVSKQIGGMTMIKYLMDQTNE